MFGIERSRVRNPKKEQERAIIQEAHSYTEEPPSDALWRVGDEKPDEEEKIHTVRMIDSTDTVQGDTLWHSPGSSHNQTWHRQNYEQTADRGKR